MEEKKQLEKAVGTREPVDPAGARDRKSAEVPRKGGTSGGIGALLMILVIGAVVWFIFFRSTAPKEVTTEMLESGIVEAITQKEIVRQLEEADFAYYLGDVETVEIEVQMPTVVSQNPQYQQAGARYEERDGYGYPVQMPLELYLTVKYTDGEPTRSDPIDITVSGVIVYVANAKTYAFRNVEIEYEEDFQTLLELAKLSALW